MDKVLILGCNGYIGRNFQKYIHTHGLHKRYCFIGIDRTHDNNPLIKITAFDLLDCHRLERFIFQERPDYILNLAGSFTEQDFDSLEKINASLSRNIFEIALKGRLNPKKILLIGSAAEYGHCEQLPLFEDQPLAPSNYYGLSKMMQTHYSSYYFRNHHLNITLARTFNIIGPVMPPSLSIGSFVRQIKNIKDSGTISVGSLNTRRDYLYIDDVVHAYWKLLLHGLPGVIYNVCSGRSIAMKDLLESLIAQSQKKISFNIDTMLIRENDINDSFGSNEKIISEIGWKPSNNIFDKLTEILNGNQ
jgi:GDP-4-dehydro-6-deoxy-D-mannose reductase